MCPSPFSVIPFCMHLPDVRTSGAHIHTRTLKTGTYSHQADGRHRQKDTGALTSTRDQILYLLEALLNRVSRAKYRTDSTADRVSAEKEGPVTTIRTPNIQEYRIFITKQPGLIASGGGGCFRWYWLLEFGEGIGDVEGTLTLDNICELIVTCKQYLTA